ncbi:MAG: hypothetical protein GXO92_02915 [FCB group bacterium]|nr:hypothetical protein [FCB group bacterium]
MEGVVYKGILTVEGEKSYLLGPNGEHFLEEDRIWEGYLKHWSGKPVLARRIPQRDYETGKRIVIMWPDDPFPERPFMELYYNERLVKYWASAFGHTAINICGEIFNFSHLANENEAMTKEEYFYRPALGEFAPSPTTGKFVELENGRPYYDKFGRNFMRTIHVVHVEGIDTDRLKAFYHAELDRIKNTPPDPKRPEKYADFNFFTRSCATIIRDGLNALGYEQIKGFFPRDLFVSAAYALQQDPKLKVSIFRMPQLTVPEAPPSAMTPLMNVKNRIKVRQLKYRN